MADISQIKLPNNTTYTVKDTNGRKEAYLTWGGRNYSGTYGPIDAAMVGELGANRLAFMPASAVTVEYTRDGGVTWLDYEASDTAKVNLFSGKGTSLVIGKADANNKATAHGSDYQLRITINAGTGKVYTVLNKIVIYCATTGSSSCTCKIQKALQSTPTEFIDHTSDIAISGWSGYNVLNINGLTTYGNAPTSQYGRVRFIFKANGGNTSYNGLIITKIFGFGGVGWITPSTMAKTGHLYDYDANQSAIFPGAIEPGTGMTVAAGKISGLAAGKSRLYTDGLAISNPTTEKDVGFIRVTGTGESDTVLEIATGDDGGAGEEIVCRQYNTNNAVDREAKLIDKSGNSSFPGTVTATNFNGKINNHTIDADVPSDAVFTDTNNRRSYFGTCSTAAATAAKEVTLANSDGWELVAGVVIGVKFSNTNTASNVTLNVNGSGAKSIYFSNAVYTGNATQITGYANLIIYYMYDGANWAFLNTGDNYRDTDTKVYQTLNSNNENHPILFSYAQSSNTTTTVNNLSYRNNSFNYNPSTKNLEVENINGKKYYWSDDISAPTGTSIVMKRWFGGSGDPEITLTENSTIIPFSKTASGNPVRFNGITMNLTLNSVTLVFSSSLTEDATIRLLIIN